MIASKWSEDNQKYLFSRIHNVKSLLSDHTAAERQKSKVSATSVQNLSGEGSPAIEILSEIFNMSKFEQDVLLLCAGFELDSEVARLCAKAHHSLNTPYPTFGLAMAIFSNPHWSALSPRGPLRRFKLLYVEQGNNSAIVSCPLRIDERILHYLMGISYLEEQIHGMIKPVKLDAELADSHQNVAESILQACIRQNQNKLPVVQLVGKDEMSKQAIASHVSSQLGLTLWRLPADYVPTKPDEIESLAQLWTRESALLGACLFISAEDSDTSAAQRPITRLIEVIPGPVFVSSRERWMGLNNSLFDETLLSIEVAKPTRGEQALIWKKYLGSEIDGNGFDRELDRLVDQFNLNTAAIRAAGINIQMNLSQHPAEQHMSHALWEAGRQVARPRMADLAQLITPKAKMDDLILLEKDKQVLRDIVLHVRNKEKVYQDWGFEAASSRGLGISALFAGESGTGKTMAD